MTDLGPDGAEVVFEASAEDLAAVDPTTTLLVVSETGIPSEAVVRHGCGRLPLCGGLLGNEVPFEWISQYAATIRRPVFFTLPGELRCIRNWKQRDTDEGLFFVGVSPAGDDHDVGIDVSILQPVGNGYQVKVENLGGGQVYTFFEGVDEDGTSVATDPVIIPDHDWQPLRAPSYGHDWNLVVTRPVGVQYLVKISAYCGS